MSRIITIDEFLRDVHVLAIVCNQWGDTGKGKVVDFFTEWADLIVRGTGGANAGHTIMLNGQEYIFHLIPSGILYDAQGKINIIGSGVAFHPGTFIEEIGYLDQHGQSYENLKLSHMARLILPQHLVMDSIQEAMKGSGRIGTTGRGIGPAYRDHVDRIGLTVNDMFNPNVFVAKLKTNLEAKLRELNGVDPEIVKTTMERLGLGEFYKRNGKYAPFDIDAIVGKYKEYAKSLDQMVNNTDDIVRKAIGRKDILLEGAQGFLLSVDYGTYPYVTSSDCSVVGLAKGAGIDLRNIDLTLGIIKAPFMTKVGEGPFPTEFGEKKSEKYCGKGTEHDIFYEAQKYIGCLVDLGLIKTLRKEKRKDELDKEYARVVKYIKSNEDRVVTLLNSDDMFIKGVGTRLLGLEYGATTARPRRTGALDLPLMRLAMQTNGNQIALTKLDVYSQCDRIPVCTFYIYHGPDYRCGERTIKKGEILVVAIPDVNVLRHCDPQYTWFDGWKSDISGCRSYDDAPRQLKNMLNEICSRTGAVIRLASVGKERSATILQPDLSKTA